MIDKDKALKLAGQLAMRVDLLLSTNFSDIAGDIEQLKDALNEYNNYIFSNIKDSNEKD